jgi:membrane dipeptidase
LEASAHQTPVIDLHVDLSYRSLYATDTFAEGSGQVVARTLRAAGIYGLVLPLYVPEDAKPHGRSRYQLERSYAHVFSELEKTRPYSLPGCGVRRAAGEPRQVSTWLAFEGSGPMGSDLAELQLWALRGVRSFGLVHSIPNQLSGSSGKGADPRRGLSETGKKFVRNVFAIGGLVDVSHASPAATMDTLALWQSGAPPVIATHSNARALAPHPRNLSDQEIRGIARTGGVIGVNFHQRFLSRGGGSTASLADVVSQVMYLLRVGGEGSVAIGSDFEGGIRPVSELRDATRFSALERALLNAGLTRGQIERVFYKNALRVLCPR